MSVYTAEGLVKHCLKAAELDTKYMWGGILRPITPVYIKQLRALYGTKAGTGYTGKRYEQLAALAGKNVYGVDCVGLIKSYYWSGKPDGGVGSPKYGVAGFPDVSASFMFGKAAKKGLIGTMPDKPGIILYSKSHPHVGVYIGNGETIESTLGARGDGVVRRRLDGFWEYWFECPYIEYGKNSCRTDTWFEVGDKVRIKSTAGCYAGTNIAVPAICKGKIFTIACVKSGRLLIKELYSWIDKSDAEKM